MRNILIADDHPLTLEGTKAYVTSLGYRVIETCNNGIVAYNSICHSTPDIAVLDLSMPGMTGLDILEKVALLKLPTRIILLTMHNEMSIYMKAKSYGVFGYILKENANEELESCLYSVSRNKVYISKYLDGLKIDQNENNSSALDKLTFTERKILELIAEQYSSKKIAESFFISERTVESHRRNIIQKLNLPFEKNALLVWALKNIKGNP